MFSDHKVWLLFFCSNLKFAKTESGTFLGSKAFIYLGVSGTCFMQFSLVRSTVVVYPFKGVHQEWKECMIYVLGDEFITPAKKFDLGLNCACGSCSKRASVNAVWLILLQFCFQTSITWACNGLFGHFQCSKWLSCYWLSHGHGNILIMVLFVPVVAVQTGYPWRQILLFFEGGLLLVDFTLACCQPNVFTNRKYTH